MKTWHVCIVSTLTHRNYAGFYDFKCVLYKTGNSIEFTLTEITKNIIGYQPLGYMLTL